MTGQPVRQRAVHRRPNRAPEHRQAASMRPLGRCKVRSDVMALAESVRRRVRKNRENTGGYSYLLACPDGWVYVLTDHSTNSTLMQQHVGWLVGCYGLARTEPGKPPRWPSVAEIADSLRQHLEDYAILSADMIQS